MSWDKLQNNSVIAFMGGFIGAMSHYIASVRAFLNLRVEELFDYAVHSLIGGLVMLAVKLLGDGLVYLVKKWIAKRIEQKKRKRNG